MGRRGAPRRVPRRAPPALLGLAAAGHLAVGCDALRVIAVGDSITEFSGPAGRGYVSFLAECTGWNISNYGVAGATMQIATDLPYWSTPEYRQAMESQPDVVYLMLGTNDAKVQNWHADTYGQDAAKMVGGFRDLPSSPHVYVMAPPPLFQDGFYGMSAQVIGEEIPPLLYRVSAALGQNVTFLDVVPQAFGGSSKICRDCMYERGIFTESGDGCHPVDFGYARMAQALCAATSPSCACPYVRPAWRRWTLELVGLVALCSLALLLCNIVFCGPGPAKPARGVVRCERGGDADEETQGLDGNGMSSSSRSSASAPE